MNNECVTSDEVLQQLAVGGSSEAEECLIRRYGRVVRSLARPYFLAGGDSEDLLQEGMLGLLSAIRRYDPAVGASFRTYSVLCIRRRLLTAIRNAAGHKNVSLDDCLSLESPLFDEDQSMMAYAPYLRDRRSPEDMVIDREESQKVYRSYIGVLSQFEQSVLGCYLSGMSYKEIAEATGKTDKSIDNAVQRIRKKISRLRPVPGDNSLG